MYKPGKKIQMSNTYSKDIDLSDKKKMLLQRLLQKEAAAHLPQRRGTSSESRPLIVPRTDREHYPLSLIQQSVWALEQLVPGEPLTSALRLKGRLDLDVLRQSLQVLLERHEILRAVFATQNDIPTQTILPAMPVDLFLVDLSDLDPETADHALSQYLNPHQSPIFDLTHGPLFKTSLVQLTSTEHVLIFSIHPILVDYSTLALLCHELVILYRKSMIGQDSPLPALSLSYADYADWQRQYLSSALLKEQGNYWKQQLAGAPISLNIPLDHPHTNLSATRPADSTRELEATLTQQALTFCKQKDLPLAHLLFTVLSLLLNRYTGQTDMVLGLLSANRTPELEPLAGAFATTLPIRVQFSEGLAGREFLHQMHNTLLNASWHQDLPLEQIVEAVFPQHDLTRVPLFQVSFAFHQLPPFSGLSAQLLSLVPTRSLQDLSFIFQYSDQQLFLTVAYNGDLFEAASIERLQEHYSQLLQSFVKQPTQTLSAFSCLTPDEQAQLLHKWNATTLAEPLAPGQCIHHLFEQQAQRMPQAIALSDGRQRLTYQELNCRANQLAHLLRRRGIGPEHLVGLCISRSLDLVIGLLAILKAGAAYVPLDPTYPRDRLAFSIQDSELTLILTQQDLLDHMPFSSEQALCLDTPELYRQESTENIPLEMSNEHLAYVIYTSGSTGRPKGVCIYHRSVVIFLQWARQQFSDEELAGVLAGTSICFDLSIFELFAPLSWGGRAILAASVLDLPYLAEREHITLLNTVPSAAAALLNNSYLPSSLLTINLAGEALTRDLVQALYRRTSVQRVCNLYGPTEDTTYSTWATISAEEEGAVTIGRPLANTQAYIVDAQMQPVPVGVAGELYLGGEGQARGYLNRPDLTAERFVPDPFSSIAGRRLYTTGDLARYRPDGSIDYLGRLDYQVKVRGFRIEPGEIEAQLRQHSAVADVVVIATENTPGEKQLVAYVVAHPQQVCDPALLHQYLQELVPAYMVPAFFIMLERLPRTVNGKVDRKALPTPDDVKANFSLSPRDMPQGEREQWLASLWQEILHLPTVGRTDNFFLCGGDSLLAMRLLARMQRDFQLSLSLEDIFTAPTIVQLSDKLQTVTIQPGLEPISPVQDRVILPDTPLPLSFAQQRIWFVDQLEDGTAMHNVPLVLALTGSLNRVALYQALREIIRRHATLRTTIRIIKGKPFQFISDLSTPAFSFIDLLACAGARECASEENFYAFPEADDEMQKEVARPFDLATGPLLRVRLLRIQEDRHILMLTMHHAITDGWSLNILIEELGVLYNSFSAGCPAPLPELLIQYTDFVAWQRDHQASRFAADLAYWKARFSPLPPALALPTDYPRPVVQTFEGDSLRFQISHTLAQHLLALSRQEGVTLFMTLLTAFLVLLARYCSQEDLVVGTSVANRSRPELESLVGFFVNTLALRADLSGNPTGRELLHRISVTALDAYRHQDAPFEQVVEAVQPQRDPARSPLFQVLFLLQNIPSAALDLHDLRIQTIEIAPPTSQFDLSFILEENSSGLCLTIEYNTQLFTSTTIERLQAHYQTLLSAFCEQPDMCIQELPLLSAEECIQLLDWNQPVTPFPATLCLHELFVEQAKRTPTAIAVQDGARALSYHELDQRANQLAHELQSRGVGPDVLVGLCLDRSLEQMVGLLAILKAGGAYVPLDPTLPVERLEYMLADARVELVLTQQAHHARLGGQERVFIYLEYSEDLGESESYKAVEQSASKANPLQLAYVIYTSGSTGQPKGVLISHCNAVNHSSAIAQHYNLTPADRVLQFSSLSFDAAVEEIFPTWLSGATLVLRPAELPSSFEQFHTWLEEQKVSIVDLPTAYWHVWVQELARHPLPLPACLRLVIIGGEKAEPERWRQWQAHVGNTVRLSNTYGPTETTVTATLYDVPVVLSAHQGAGALPIGRPLANMLGYVLDARQQLVPVGVQGELYLSGEGVARGYLGQPELTAQRFVPDPLSEQPGQRMYRTGDWVYQRADGQLVYVQRQDQQVKLRGFRIELGEIERVLRGQPTIQEAVVLLREDQPGFPQLVAYIQPIAGSSLDVSLLRLSLKKQLPAYMLPAAIFPLETLPLTLGGKIDRKQLPSPDQLHLAERPLNNIPQGPLEETLAQIWKKVLRLPIVERTENFFEIGGHSLLAMQILAAIREELQINVSIRQFFAAPTIVEMAALIELGLASTQTRSETQLSAFPPLVPIERTGEFPLSFAQQRLWFLDQLEGSSATYNIPVALHFIGELNIPVLQQCMREIVRRHETLRTTFPKGQDTPIQCIHVLPLAPVEVVEFPNGALVENKAAILQDIQTEAQRPFDLATGPLLRTRVLRLGQQEHIMIFVMHHIISDGWSMGILAQELNTLYNAFIAGKPSPLPELSIQYVDFVAWQRNYLQGPRLAAHLAYWQQQLTGTPTSNLPTDHPRVISYSALGAGCSEQWPQSITQQLLTFSQQENVTLFMTLLTGLLVLLAHYSGQRDITVGTPIANRSHPALEPLVGLFVNTLALRTSLAGNPTGHELLQRVRDVTLGAYEHQDVPFEQVVEAVHPQRQSGVSPLFQVLFVLQNTATEELSLSNLQVEPLEVHTATAKFDLSIGAEINTEGLAFGIEYNTQLFERTTIQHMQTQYRALLKHLVAHAECTLADLYEVLSG